MSLFRISTTHNIVAVLALTFIPQIAVSADHKDKIREALIQAYLGSRYDVIEASIDNCEVRFFVKDTEACSSGAQIQSHGYFYDLRHFDAEIWNEYAKPVDDMWRFRVELTPKGEWATQVESIRAEGKRRLEAARAEFGWGQTAVIEANSDFSKRYNIEEFFSLGSTGYCPNAEIIGPVGRHIQLQGRDIKELAMSFEAVMQSCDSDY